MVRVVEVTDPEFVDDIAILGEDPTIVQPLLYWIACVAKTVGLETNIPKWKFFASQDPPRAIHIGGENLSSINQRKCQARDEVKHCEDRARREFRTV